MNILQCKLLLAIPTFGLLDYRFAMSLTSLALPPNTTLMMSPRSMIDTSRNLICKKFLSNSLYTHLLMIDDDHSFEPDLIQQLLSHNVDIVGALAFKRRPDFQPCVYLKNKKDNKYYSTLPKGFQEVDVIGTGAILITRKVLEKLNFPYFWTNYDKDGTHWSVDFNFCKQAKKAGFKIFVDANARLGHIGDADIITEETFVKYHNISNKVDKAKH